MTATTAMFVRSNGHTAQAEVNNPDGIDASVSIYTRGVNGKATFVFLESDEARELARRIVAAADEADQINDARHREQIQLDDEAQWAAIADARRTDEECYGPNAR